MTNVLVLDNGYRIHRFERWEKSVKKIEKNKVEVLSEWADKKLQNWADARNAPVIIRLLNTIPYRGQTRGKKFNRRHVWERDNHQCQYCQKTLTQSQMTYDHVIPKAQGGKCIWTNIVCSCTTCNAKKDNRTPEQANMKLIRQPFIPKNTEQKNEVLAFLKNLKNITGQEWIDYIYQNIELVE